MKLMLWPVLLAALALPAAASVKKDLNDEQLADLQAGNLVLRSEDVPGGTWPRLIVYTKVQAPVSGVEKVFRDYESAADYIPGMVSAEVLARPDPDTYEVRYTSAMPLIGQSKSTVRNRYRYDGDTLVVSWNLIEATHADESTGELRVEPDGQGGSILRYANYVKPKSSLAALARPAAVSEVKRTVQAIKKESEKRSR